MEQEIVKILREKKKERERERERERKRERRIAYRKIGSVFCF
jgi:hypothetical protein